MAWQTPKTNWTTNDYFDYGDANRIEGNILELYNGGMAANSIAEAKLVSVSQAKAPTLAKFLSVVGSIYGGSPPSTGLQIQAGSADVTSNVNGDFTVTLPTGFPTGLLTVVAMAGDDLGSDSLVNGVVSGSSNSQFNGSIDKWNGSAMVGYQGTFRLNWIAIGW